MIKGSALRFVNDFSDAPGQFSQSVSSVLQTGFHKLGLANLLPVCSRIRKLPQTVLVEQESADVQTVEHSLV